MLLCTHILMPYSFSPLSILIASIASGIGRPPRMRTPSISKANANVSADSVSPGVTGDLGELGVLAVGVMAGSSRVVSRFLVKSSSLAWEMEAAKPPWWDLERLEVMSLGGTTTTGPGWARSLGVAALDERRRRPGRGLLLRPGTKKDRGLVGSMLGFGESCYIWVWWIAGIGTVSWFDFRLGTTLLYRLKVLESSQRGSPARHELGIDFRLKLTFHCFARWRRMIVGMTAFSRSVVYCLTNVDRGMGWRNSDCPEGAVVAEPSYNSCEKGITHAARWYTMQEVLFV